MSVAYTGWLVLIWVYYSPKQRIQYRELLFVFRGVSCDRRLGLPEFDGLPALKLSRQGRMLIAVFWLLHAFLYVCVLSQVIPETPTI